MTSSPPKHEIFRIIFAIIVSGIVTILCVAALLPFFLSTHWGNICIAKLINTRIAGNVDFKKFDISWTGEQKIEGLRLYDSEGHEIASFETAIANSSLLNLLLHSGKNVDYLVSGLQAEVVQDVNGVTNIQRALDPVGTVYTNKSLPFPPLTISLSDVNMKAHLSDGSGDTVKLSGKSVQNGMQGNFDADITVSKDNIVGKVNVSNFPVALLDEIASLSDVRLRGAFLKILGDRLDLNVEQKEENKGLSLVLKSPTTTAKIDARTEDKKILFNLNGQHNQQGSTPFPFQIKGSLNNLYKPNGDIDIDHLTFSLDGQFQQFPVRLLAQYLNMDKEIPKRISATLGDKIDGTIHTQIDKLKGPIVINVAGSNGNITLDAEMHQDTLTLNKNFQAKAKLTKEFGEVVLDEIFPLATGLIGSDNFLTITIESAGFSLPIKNFTLDKVRIGKASLDLGKVFFRDDGQFGSVVSLFNTSGKGNIEVWFTPLYISMKSGVINISRIDMLIMNSYPVASWGTVDFVKDRVNMVVGLSAQSLLNGFNLQNLGKDYLLQIPFHGTIAKPLLDRKKALAKIAALVATNRGPEGLLIGTVLQIASGGLTEEPSPPPTTNPLPWSSSDSKQPDKQTTDKKTKKNPIHQVEEKASALLKNIISF